MIEITFLGTGSMQPTKNRNHSAILLQYKSNNFLFDCGEGTQRQMRIAGLKPSKINRIFLSHWHGDHVFGLPGLMNTIKAEQPEKTIYIYGPKGTKKYLKYLFKSFASREMIDLKIKEVRSGLICENEEFQIEAQYLKHSIPCLGFSFKEKDKLRINLEQAQRLGLSGPILGKIQQGNDVVFKGKKIKVKDVAYLVPGKKISYVADTLPCEGAELLAKDADLLISEGTHLDDIKEKSEKYMHMTVKQAALIASENNAHKLIITHISPRYKSSTEALEEAKTYFQNSLIAEDFMKINL